MGRLVLPSILFSGFSTYPYTIIVSVLMVEISQSLGVQLGVAGQIRTFQSASMFIGSLLVATISHRYNSKHLLLTGQAFLVIASTSNYIVPTFPSLLFSAILAGIGMALIIPMTNTLVAENYPIEKRNKVLGFLGVYGGISFLLGGTIATILAFYGGWRFSFLAYSGIISIMGLLIGLIGLPQSSTIQSEETIGLLEAFKGIAASTSALGCLAGTVLAFIAIQGLYFFSFSFLKEVHGANASLVGLIYSGTSAFFILGSLVSGWMINRFSSKSISIWSTIAFSVCTLLLIIVPSFWISVFFLSIGHFFDALRYTALASLSLEQVPNFKGSMMSLRGAATSLGLTIGSGIGGLILLWWDWQMMGVAYLVSGFLASSIIFLKVKDP
jgi:predicted MFS family arabinose efflux permease